MQKPGRNERCKASELLRYAHFLTWCVFRRLKFEFSEYARSQFSQIIVWGRETSSRFQCETNGEKERGNVMAMLNIFFSNVLLWSAVLDQHKLTGSCYRWSWFEARSKICTAERQAKLRGKNEVKFRTSSKRISLLCNILLYCEGVDFKVTCVKFVTVFITRRDAACF
jgi:hypothetical protein